MTRNETQALEKLRVLSTKLYAATMISATEDFILWHPDIREPYMLLVTDMSREVRDIVLDMIMTPATEP